MGPGLHITKLALLINKEKEQFTMSSSQGTGSNGWYFRSFSIPPTGPSPDTYILLQIARQLPTSIMERVLQERYEEAAEEQQEEDR